MKYVITEKSKLYILAYNLMLASYKREANGKLISLLLVLDVLGVEIDDF